MKPTARRGQGAMEYLMTYGWAILILMVVGIIMWQMGVFNVGGSSPPRVTGTNYQRPIDATVFIRATPAAGQKCRNAADDCVTIEFVNAEPGTITFSPSYLTLLGVTLPAACSVDGTATDSGSPPTVRQGAKYSYSCKGDPSFTKTFVARDVVEGNLTLTYTVSIVGTPRSRNERATFRGPAE